MSKYLLPAGVLVVVISCYVSRRTVVEVDPVRKEVIDISNQLVGSRYKYGGKTKKGFDCSGLTHFVFSQVGIDIYGPSRHQTAFGVSSDLDKSQPGDLIFFKRNQQIFHVGIIVEHRNGELWVVHSTSSRGVIREDVFKSSYWRPKIDQVRTVIGTGNARN